MSTDSLQDDGCLNIIVFGVTGDLAKKKTIPCLFELYKGQHLPAKTRITGVGRNEWTKGQLADKFQPILQKLGSVEEVDSFLDIVTYFAAAPDNQSQFVGLNSHLKNLELSMVSSNEAVPCNRLFYFALPPFAFEPVAKNVDQHCRPAVGWLRAVIEKPFGRNLQTYQELSSALSKCFTESETFRIDHYLGKTMTQSIMTLRFANAFLEPMFNRDKVANVQIVFKENLGTGGRGAYFDKYGIIRDVMQNHLFQILTLVAMEQPVSMKADDIRDEKVRVLKCIRPPSFSEVVLGQFVAANGQDGYKDDTGVPATSKTPTFASAIFRIDNQRWDGVPFILKCGKGLNERKAEIRIQFKQPPGPLFREVPRNELVIRVQPDEAVYMKCNANVPGLELKFKQAEMDLTLQKRFDVQRLPDAYERLILDVVHGDHNLFVRDDELRYSWQIFEDLLSATDEGRLPVHDYEFGSRGPKQSDAIAMEAGFQRHDDYTWQSK